MSLRKNERCSPPIHTDAVLNATRRRVAGRFLQRGQMPLTKAKQERL